MGTSLARDQYRCLVHLQRGTNSFLIKLCQDEQTETWTVDWKFQFRVTDRLGGAIHERGAERVGTNRAKRGKKMKSAKSNSGDQG